MSDRGGLFQITLLSIGVLAVFGLVALLDDIPLPITEVGDTLPNYWPETGVWEEVSVSIAPLAIVICCLGIAAWIVTHR